MPSHRKFDRTDVLINRIKTYPKVEFMVYDRKVYYNNKGPVSGAFASNVGHVDTGYISIYEENVDRPTGQLIYPFVVKGSDYNCFRSITTASFNTTYQYGDTITGSYPMSASISVDRFAANASRSRITALKTAMESYRCLSQHYEYDAGLYGDKDTQKLALISIPSIFYGSSIKKGSVDLNFYVNGALIGRLQDTKRNGELIQTEPYNSVGSGSVAGVCLYNEGEIVLTGAWNISTATTEVYDAGLSATYPRWYYFASTGSSGAGENIPYSSFIMKFQGVSYVDTMTMFCHAPRGKVNSSNNPTWIEYGQNRNPITSSIDYVESSNLAIKNTVKSPFTGASGSFEKQVYINKIVVYDKDKKAVGVAQLSRPIRKKESESITFKVKTDI